MHFMLEGGLKMCVGLRNRAGQAGDAFWPEAGPVVAVYLNDGSLHIAQGEHVFAGGWLKADVYYFVIQTGTVECFLRCVALHTCWLSE